MIKELDKNKYQNYIEFLAEVWNKKLNYFFYMVFYEKKNLNLKYYLPN